MLGGVIVQKVAAAIPPVPAVGVEHSVEPAAFLTEGLDVGTGLYVAQPGDSMWSIATALVPYGQTAEFVDLLVALNGGATLSIGQRVVLPER